MKRILASLILILLFIPLCYATTEIATKGQAVTLWAYTSQNSANSANITFYFPDGSVSTNYTMSSAVNVSSTKVFFKTNYTPNMTGNYAYLVLFLNSGGSVVDTQTETFYVQEASEMYFTVLMGLLALIVLCFWYGRTMANKPITAVNLWIFDNVTTRDFSIIFDIVGGFLIIPLLAFLSIIASGSSYSPIFDKLYIVGTYFIGFTLLAYLVFYLMYRYNEGIETLGDYANVKKR